MILLIDVLASRRRSVPRTLQVVSAGGSNGIGYSRAAARAWTASAGRLRHVRSPQLGDNHSGGGASTTQSSPSSRVVRTCATGRPSCSGTSSAADVVLALVRGDLAAGSGGHQRGGEPGQATQRWNGLARVRRAIDDIAVRAGPELFGAQHGDHRVTSLVIV
jgi:hypothetical protein